MSIEISIPIPSLECQVAIIGAGVIGLACAAELSQNHSVVVVEGQGKFGQDTSSRNSEVIHSGVYYAADSLKTEWCITGRELLYSFCERMNVPHRQCGKWLVATNSDEIEYLEKVFLHCQKLDVPCDWMESKAVLNMQPEISVVRALHFPRTGIVDSHALMATLESQALRQEAIFGYRNKVSTIETRNSGWEIGLDTPDGPLRLSAGTVINCAGLAAAQIANLAHGTERFEHRYCRGRYFSLGSRFDGVFSKLVYPVPPKDGLGIHITIALDGSARLGPDIDWTKENRYDRSPALYDDAWPDTLKRQFTESAQRFLPSLEPRDLAPGFVGLRPKLFIDGTSHPDFYLHSQDRLISLLGIESPGLTASLAIAKQVAEVS